MLASIDARELEEWLLYANLEPFGAEVERLAFGSVTAAVYNVNRKKDSKPLSAADCALHFEQRPLAEAGPLKPKSSAALKAVLLTAFPKPESKS